MVPLAVAPGTGASEAATDHAPDQDCKLCSVPFSGRSPADRGAVVVEVHVFPGCGHWAMIEQKAAWESVVRLAMI